MPFVSEYDEKSQLDRHPYSPNRVVIEETNETHIDAAQEEQKTISPAQISTMRIETNKPKLETRRRNQEMHEKALQENVQQMPQA